MYMLVFVGAILFFSEVRSSFTIPIVDFLKLLLYGILFSLGVGLWVAYTGLTEIRFEEESVHFVSRFFNVSRTKSIPFEECKVDETFYWKFINHFFLRFYQSGKLVIVIGKSEWANSYSSIREEIARRLDPTQYQFTESDGEVARRLTSRSS
jgi:hypothetical protein